ncbi:MAG: GyrI-like domain-containing protein [Promethearchaeota archaeon]
MSENSKIRISIGKFSFITRLSKRALRLYDEKKLLVAKRDSFNNYRYYETEQIETAFKIKMLSWLGFGLMDIKKLLKEFIKADTITQEFEELFKTKLSDTQIEIQRLKKVKEILQQIIEGKTINEVLLMKTTEPTLKDVPNIRVISKRERGGVQTTLGKILSDIMIQIFRPENRRGQVAIAGAPLVIYHDQDINAKGTEPDIDLQDLDLEVAVPITGKIISKGEFDVKNLDSVKVVSVIHTGPYNELEVAYTNIIKYIEKNSHEIAGPFREVYLNNPQEIPEEEILTEVQIPIK